MKKLNMLVLGGLKKVKVFTTIAFREKKLE